MEAMIQAPDATPLQQAQYAFYGVGWATFTIVGLVTLIASLIGILSMTLVVAPNATQRFSAALRERNVASFFAGIPIAGLFGLTTLVVHKAPALVAVNFLVFGVVLLLALAAASEDIGRRLFWACGKEGSRASHLAAGWMVFALGALFPVIGQVLILPYVTLSGLGSIAVSFFGSRAAPAAASKDVDFDVK
jgi:hypothetical protein